MHNYSEYKQNIQTGDLLLWNTSRVTSFLSLFMILIQKILHTKYSHVGIAIVLGDRYMILEAQVPVVRLIPISSSRDFYHLPLNLNITNKQYNFLFNSLGIRYSLIDLFTYIFRLGNNKNSYYCSELAADFYSNIGLIDDSESGINPKVLSDKMILLAGVEPVLVKLDKANL